MADTETIQQVPVVPSAEPAAAAELHPLRLTPRMEEMAGLEPVEVEVEPL